MVVVLGPMKCQEIDRFSLRSLTVFSLRNTMHIIEQIFTHFKSSIYTSKSRSCSTLNVVVKHEVITPVKNETFLMAIVTGILPMNVECMCKLKEIIDCTYSVSVNLQHVLIGNLHVGSKLLAILNL